MKSQRGAATGMRKDRDDRRGGKHPSFVRMRDGHEVQLE